MGSNEKFKNRTYLSLVISSIVILLFLWFQHTQIASDYIHNETSKSNTHKTITQIKPELLAEKNPDNADIKKHGAQWEMQLQEQKLLPGLLQEEIIVFMDQMKKANIKTMTRKP